MNFGEMSEHEVRRLLVNGYMIHRWMLDFDEDNPNTLTMEEIVEQGYYREEAERKFRHRGEK